MSVGVYICISAHFHSVCILKLGDLNTSCGGWGDRSWASYIIPLGLGFLCPKMVTIALAAAGWGQEVHEIMYVRHFAWWWHNTESTSPW